MSFRRCAAVSLAVAGIGLSVAATGLASAAPRTMVRSALHPIAATSLAQPALPIDHAGRWLTDAQGRVLLIHGINLSMKGSLSQSRAYRFGGDDAAFLAHNGFNAVRLTVERYDIEPTPGHFDPAYLAFVRRMVRLLSSYGILTLIDFHQDEFGPVFHDNGYPAWMTSTGGLPNVTSVGFPFQYLANPAVNHAFDNLWNNGKDSRGTPMWTDDAQILSTAVSALHSTPGVLGYEIINEPWPGSQYASCFVLLVGCPSFDQGKLSSYYAAMDKAIRAADPDHLVFFEPLVSFNYGIPSSVTPPPGDAKVAFAFHDYPLCSAADDAGLPVSIDTACGVESKLAISNAVSYAAAHSTGLLETEFGATTKPAPITQAATAYDAAMVPWMFWSYQELVGSGSGGAFTTPPSKTPDRPVLASLARPYPQLIAGTPTGYGYDATSHVFTASYSTGRAKGSGRFGGDAVSQFAVPRIAYPHGYEVSTVGGAVVSGNDDPLLLIAANPGAKRVSVRVTPATA
ncbi:MAG TPA: cellulase family glycosylhydrolase [Mycobacteriales bacterium]|nr:cellulase family glycosylhydrolase [Mycobacteriales bacterium]